MSDQRFITVDGNEAAAKDLVMSYIHNASAEILVAGFGSRHGDDQVGWRVAEMIQQRSHGGARALAISEPSALLGAMENCQRLIIVDACRSKSTPGRVTRLRWPSPRVAMHHSRSTHGLAVGEVLRLAEQLGRLPQNVEIFAIEASDCLPNVDMTPVVLHAAEEVASRILAEVREAAHA